MITYGKILLTMLSRIMNQDSLKLQHIHVEVSFTADKLNSLAYNMTIFINTGTIQAQGNNFKLFINEHIGKLKECSRQTTTF